MRRIIIFNKILINSSQNLINYSMCVNVHNYYVTTANYDIRLKTNSRAEMLIPN